MDKSERNFWFKMLMSKTKKKLYKNELEKRGLETEIIEIGNFKPDIQGDWVKYQDAFTPPCIDKNVCISAYNILLNNKLDLHINNVASILKNGYSSIIDFDISNSSLTSELSDLYKNIEKNHTQIKFLSSDSELDQINITDHSTIEFIKRCLLRGMLSQPFNIIMLADFYNGSRKFDKSLNQIHFESFHNLSVYLKASKEYLEKKISESQLYIMIYDLLYAANLLPIKQMNDVKLEIDKHKYIRKTLSNFYKKYPLNTSYAPNYGIMPSDDIQSRVDKIQNGKDNSSYASVFRNDSDESDEMFWKLDEEIKLLRKRFGSDEINFS